MAPSRNVLLGSAGQLLQSRPGSTTNSRSTTGTGTATAATRLRRSHLPRLTSLGGARSHAASRHFCKAPLAAPTCNTGSIQPQDAPAADLQGVSCFSMTCEHLRTTVGTAPGKTIPFSDHEAVMATLRLDRWDQDLAEELKPEVVNIMNEAQTEVRVGLHKAVNRRFSTGRISVLGFLLLLLEAFMALVSLLGFQTEQAFPKLSYYILGSVAFTVLLIAGLCHIFHIIEVRLLQETQEQLRLGTQALQERLGHT